MSALLVFGLTALLSAPRPAAPTPVGGEQAIAIRAKRVETGAGEALQDGVVLIERGKVSAVGVQLELPAGAQVFDHDGVVTAGLIACHSYDGLRGENHDRTRSVMPELRVADAFSPTNADFERALAAGITSVVLAPTPQNLVGGRAAVVKTSGGAALRSAAHLVLSLSDAALQANRYPTSSQGALAELEARFAEPEGAFAEAAAGDLPVLIDVGETGDVLRATRLAARHKLRGALVGAPSWLEGQAAAISRAGLGVVLGPYPAGTSPALLATAAELGAAGVPLGFALDAPYHHPDQLRLSAAQCVRAGLEPAAARRALTADAARLAGVADRAGQLQPGFDADLVLWSGDPLDLSSAVEAVFVDGELVHGNLQAGESAEAH